MLRAHIQDEFIRAQQRGPIICCSGAQGYPFLLGLLAGYCPFSHLLLLLSGRSVALLAFAFFLPTYNL